MAAETTHPRGAQYWEESRDTHKADHSYYQLVADSLQRLVVPLLTPGSTVLDFGCGNGEYTSLLAHASGLTLGLDVSRHLVDQANEANTHPNVNYFVSGRPPRDRTFDLVACMGVLVCVIDDAEFEQILSDLAASVASSGHLVLRETFAWNGSQILDYDDYVAHYRTPLHYLRLLAECGLELILDEHLVTWSEHDARSNHLWVLQRST